METNKLPVTNPDYHISKYHETVQVKHGMYANAACGIDSGTYKNTRASSSRDSARN